MNFSISLVIMIFVNYGGGKYWFFQHVEWNGIAVADLVFPWFVFIMGSAIPFSLRSLKKSGVPKRNMFLKVLRRSCLLFLIGLSLNSQSGVLLEELRIPGVLQRLALCYFIVAIPHMFFIKLSTERVGDKRSWLRDITDYWVEWLVHLSLLAVYLCLTFLLSVPGCPRGYLGPGGLHDGGQYYNCSGGAAGYIDKVVLGNDHIYQGATFKILYKATENYDPEGILGTLCAAFMCFLGLQVGKIVLYHKSQRDRVIRWFVWAIVTGAIAALLCRGTQNDGWIPVNKNLWSISFTMALSSMAFILLSILYVVIDVYSLWLGTPFIYPGMNSLVLYIGHSVLGTFFPIRWTVSTDDHWYNIAMATWATSMWCIVAFVMYKKNIFVAL